MSVTPYDPDKPSVMIITREGGGVVQSHVAHGNLLSDEFQMVMRQMLVTVLLTAKYDVLKRTPRVVISVDYRNYGEEGMKYFAYDGFDHPADFVQFDIRSRPQYRGIRLDTNESKTQFVISRILEVVK